MTPQEVTLLVATLTVIVVPASVAIGKRVHAWWMAHRHKKLAEKFITREEHEMQFQTMAEQQSAQHQENKDYLDTIRSEAHDREKRLLRSIEASQQDNRETRTRVDQIFVLLTKAK